MGRKIKLYHGSTSLFDKPDPRYFREHKDFGVGFYLTDDYNMAKDWAMRNINIGDWAHMYMLTLDLEDIRKNFSVHEFNSTSIAWLDYVISNRTKKTSKGGYKSVDYDLVIGNTADARAQQLVTRFIGIHGGSQASKSDKIQLIRDLDAGRLKKQYCIKSVRLLNYATQSMTHKSIRKT